MSVKTAGVGHFQIPTAPAAGTSVTSGAANVYTTSAVQLIASTAAALYITGIYAEEAAVSAPTYKSVQLMIGAAGSETIIGQYLISPSTGSTVTRTYRPIFPPIPVAVSTRIAVKTADSVGALATLISLEVIAQSNVVDDGIAITTVTTVTNQLTAAAIATGVWQDATAADFTTASSIGKSLYVSGNVVPGGAGALSIVGSNMGTVSSVTGAVGSVTAAVSLPSIPANWITAAGITAAALNGKGDWATVNPTNLTAAQIATGVWKDATAADFTGAGTIGLSVMNGVALGTGLTVGSVSGAVGSVTAAVALPSIPANWITAGGINAAALNGKGDWLLSSGYTAPDNTSITAIKAKTDSLTFTVAAKLDVNVLVVNGIAVTGLGTSAVPWGPA